MVDKMMSVQASFKTPFKVNSKAQVMMKARYFRIDKVTTLAHACASFFAGYLSLLASKDQVVIKGGGL